MTPIEHYARVIVYFAAMLAVTICGEVVGRVWCLWLAPRGSEARVRRANIVTRHCGVVLTQLTIKVLRSRLEVRGEVPQGRYVVVSNHQSTADIAILTCALRGLNLKFVAKKQLSRGIPTVSMALRHWGSAVVSREASREDLERIKVMARGLEHWNASAVVFPEGTRSRGGRLLPYKAAAVRIIATHSHLPILPVAIDGTHVAFDLPSFARFMPGAHGIVTIGTPIPPDDWEGRVDNVVTEIQNWTHEMIEAARRDGSLPPPRGWTAVLGCENGPR